MAAPKVKGIKFTDKDAVLCKWCDTAKDNSYKFGALIKTAIRYYIKNASYCCIGKIYMAPTDYKAYPNGMCITFYIGDSPDIVAWMQDLKKTGLKAASAIRSILHNSITVVTDPSEVWLPDPSAMYLLLNKSVPVDETTVHPKPPAHMEIHSPISSISGDSMAKKHKNQPDVPPEDGGQQPSITKDAASIVKDPSPRKPRAFALSGVSISHDNPGT